FTGIFTNLVPGKSMSVLIVCGTGNNGGDGLAIARMLQEAGYDSVCVWVIQTKSAPAPDFSLNLKILQKTPVAIQMLKAGDDLPPITQDILIDALLGSGLNRPLESSMLKTVQHLNRSAARVIAVDVPTGLRCDGSFDSGDTVLKADDVICFQRPKLSYLLPE